MEPEIDTLRGFLRNWLVGHPDVELVQPKTTTSKQVHLSVFVTAKGRPIGIETDKTSIQNIWLRAMNMPKDLPPRIKVTKKMWVGQSWKGEDGKGANSNLKGFDLFRTHNLVRLELTTVEDAKALLEAII